MEQRRQIADSRTSEACRVLSTQCTMHHYYHVACLQAGAPGLSVVLEQCQVCGAVHSCKCLDPVCDLLYALMFRRFCRRFRAAASVRPVQSSSFTTAYDAVSEPGDQQGCSFAQNGPTSVSCCMGVSWIAPVGRINGFICITSMGRKQSCVE